MTDVAETADTRFWNKSARKYARSPIKDLAGYERTLDRVKDCLSPTDAVLELGCGTGTTALKLAPSVTRYIGTDVSSEMIAIAREKLAAETCRNVEFSVVGADAATWPSGPFDVVAAFNVIHLVPDRMTFLRQVYTALKPNGLFLSKTPCLSEMNPLIRLAVPVARAIGKAPSVAFFTAADLVRDMAAAGFVVEEKARHGSIAHDPRIFIVARR